MGPVYPFKEMFETMSRKDVDFWGITAYAGETVNDEKIPTHLQAYWHAYRRSLVSSQAFHEYWENMPLWKDYAEVTRKHEMTIHQAFRPAWLQMGVLHRLAQVQGLLVLPAAVHADANAARRPLPGVQTSFLLR